LRLKNSLNGYF